MSALKFNVPPSWIGNGPMRIVVVGAGGTGSDLVVRLAKLHTQLVALGGAGFDVTVYDSDTVEAHNCGRQHFSPSAVGLAKSLVLVNSINLAYALDWKGIPDNLDPTEDYHTLLYGTDLVISCVDNAGFRAQLCRTFRGVNCRTMLLDGGNGRDLGQVVLGHLGVPGGRLRLPNVYDLWPELDALSANDEDEPSCSAHEAMQKQSWPVNQAVAFLMGEMLWTLLRQGWIDYHGTTFTLAPMRTTPMMIDPAAWAFMGYEPEREAA